VEWNWFRGGVSSVDDVALNTIGAVLAALCSYRWWRRPAEPATPT
jgi:VanZ family protein